MTRVRIEKIELNNFKNVGFSSVNLSTSVEGEQLGSIKGIYGQNGSGKTSLITAVGIVKDMLSGIPLPSDIQNYIKKGENQSSINIEFSIRTDQRKYDVFYELIIGTENSSNNSNIIVKAENIKYRYSDFTKDEDQIKVTLLNVDYSNWKITPLTKERFITNLSDQKNYVPVNIALATASRKSFIFGDKQTDVSHKSIFDLIQDKKVNKEYEIISILQKFSRENLFVVDSKLMGLSDANIILPLRIKTEGKNKRFGTLPIDLSGPSDFEEGLYEVINDFIEATSEVMGEIVPGLKIGIVDLGNSLNKDGLLMKRFELVSIKGQHTLPIRYESDGIKKIISLINLLIAMYNSELVSVFVDEIDSGVYEHLLGELLLNIQDYGKGQLIFTSHNLRPLELLDNENLIFTTTNPMQRYVQLKYVNANNNVRDFYYRTIGLGGQEEELYAPTRGSRMRFAFRKACKNIYDHE